MNTSFKKRVDRILGLPAIMFLNVLAKMLGFFLRLDHSLNRSPKCIVISKFLGMGSIIQSSPLLQTIKMNYPDCQLVFVTNKGNVRFLKLYPFVDEVYSVNDSSLFSLIKSTLLLIKYLWKKRIDVFIDLETYSYYSSIVTTLSLARNRFSFYRKESNIRMGIFTHMMFFNQKAPISMAYLQMANLLNCTNIESNLYKPRVDDKYKRSIENKIPGFNNMIDKFLVIINPNASDLRTERRWSQENYVKLIRNLSAKSDKYHNLLFILIGSAGEREYVSKIYGQLANAEINVIDTSGTLEIEELIYLIESSGAVITNDSGPMHIAFSLQKKVLSLFGPCSPDHYGYHPGSLCIYKNVYCSPCVHEFEYPPCKGDNECMKQISVNEVEKAFDEIYSGSYDCGNSGLKNIIYMTDNQILGFVKR